MTASTFEASLLAYRLSIPTKTCKAWMNAHGIDSTVDFLKHYPGLGFAEAHTKAASDIWIWVKNGQMRLFESESKASLAKRRAAEPLKPKFAQNFDCSPLPLFSDSHKQKELPL